MSAAGSQGPNALGPQYGGVGGGGGYSVPTPTSTVHDDYPHDVKVSAASGLPPFSSFEMADVGHTYTQLDHPAPWDYYGEGLTGRLMDRDMHNMHQPNYRPWESKPLDGSDPGPPPPGHPNGGPPGFPGSKLPSFQSQFSFGEQQNPDGTLTPLPPSSTPASPSSTSSGLPSFHTLSAVPVPGVPVGVPRGYPLVPAPVQAREVPAIQQQLMDERHIHLAFGGVPPGVPPPGVPPPGLPPHQQLSQFHHPLIPGHPTHPGHPAHPGHPGHHPVLTMVKSEPVTIVTSTPPQLTQLHHSNFQNPMSMLDKCDENGHLGKLEDAGLRGLDSRKKERRKARASSMESSAESDGAGSSSLESSGQVAAVSSTGSGFKSPLQTAPPVTQGPGSDDGESSSGEKPVKKKRKRCGECIGCQRKDNCGDCAPCRNEKSHQICKMRRCEKLTEKKGYRNKARPSVGGPQTPQSLPQPQTPTPQAQQPGQGAPVQSVVQPDQSMLGNVSEQPNPPVMPFYGNNVPGQPGSQMESVAGFGPPPMRDRFGGWPPQPGDPGTLNGLSSWSPAPPQSHNYIQQVPPHHPPPHQIDELRHYHPQYAATPAYQGAGYQQPFLVDPSQNPAFQQQPQAPQTPQTQLPYGTPTSQPPSSPAQPPLTPRSNYSQAHTPQPSPTPHQVNGINGNIPQRNGVNGSYLDASPVQSMEYVNGSYTPSQENSMAPPTTPTPTSRSSSVHMDTGDSNGNMSVNGSSPHHGMNGTMNGRKTPSHNSNAPGSGNAMPGYPLHQAPPQLIQQSLHNSSGYPGQDISSGAAGENGMSSPLWNNSNAPTTSINNHQPNNNAGSANANGNTNASANRSVWNGGGQDRPPSSLGHSPKMDSSPHQHYQQDQSNSNSTSPVNSRLKTMILNKQQQQQQQQQYGQQMQQQQYGQQMYGQQQQLTSPGGESNGQQMMSPPRHSDQYGQQAQQGHHSRPPSRQSPNPSQNTAGHFLVEGHHLQRSVIPEGGGIWEWGSDNLHGTNLNPVSAMENFVKFAELGDGGGEGSNSVKGFQGGQLGFQGMKSETTVKSESKTDDIWSHEKSQYERISEQNSIQNTNDFFLKKTLSLGHYSNEDATSDTIKIKEEPYLFRGDGGPISLEKISGAWCCRQGGTDKPTPEHLRDGCCPGQGLQTLDEVVDSESEKPKDKNGDQWSPETLPSGTTKDFQDHLDRLRNNVRTEVPDCDCFPADKLPPEPGSYYTHLGAAKTLPELRCQVEERSGFKDKAVRIEKVLYTGKEGKTTQGCPLAKWVIRRSSMEEKILVIVKHRQGHKCSTAWIVVVLVAWEGIPIQEADHVYTLLSNKLNRFGLPTTRRCATNEPRTCACQGLDPNSCGASFSFGCSWSMYYNGCKYARSKTVRKFRLSVRSEEQEVEERMHSLASLVSPLYQSLAPEAFQNQTQFEREASECRLGFKTGRPFSGVTACIDFCAHSHRDLHNMNNGCTVVVSLTKHRSLSKPDDEQLHVLPLYIMDDSDEYGSKEDQAAKEKSGAIETLSKYPCEVRVRSVPLQPCRRHGKKRGKEEEPLTEGTAGTTTVKKEPGTLKSQGNCAQGSARSGTNATSCQQSQSPGNAGMSLEMAMEAMEAQLQSSQVTSTVLDSPVAMYQGWGYEAWPHAGRAPGPAAHAWMGADGQRWPDYAHPTRTCLERADADSTTAVASWATSLSPAQPAARRDSLAGHSLAWEGESSSPSSVLAKSTSCTKRTEPEEAMSSSHRLSASSASSLNRHDAQSPSFDLPTSAFSPSSVADLGSAPTDPLGEGDKSSGRQQQKKASSSSSSCWGEGGDPPSLQWDGSTPSSPFRVPKARHAATAAAATPFETPKLEAGAVATAPSAQWETGSAFSSTASSASPGAAASGGQYGSKGAGTEKFWMAGDCALSGGASKSLAFGSHGLKQESIFDDPKHLSDYQAFGAHGVHGVHNTAVASAANPFACSMPGPGLGPGSAYGYGYASMFPESKGFNAGWSDPYVDPHYAQFQGPAMNLNSLYGGATSPYHSASSYMPPAMATPYGFVPATRWDLYAPPPYFPVVPETPKAEPIGEVTDFVDNEECFKDSQMGGVAIALGHGSVLFECAKHEMHATTALRRPNRLQPTRISLVFYQHRNLNRPKHGWDEWEEKMRLRKLGVSTNTTGTSTSSSRPATPIPTSHVSAPASAEPLPCKPVSLKRSSQFMMRTPTFTTTTWTTLFPMHPCVVTGPYQEGSIVG
ncbi:DNA N6-methyl adenine demethylase isoform X2 [Thrips palmi]|uniref:Methylcytosine dioxygenase TET n=1 Tax=Thrips palmi TaxID=161013 RepID=A0A6P8ZLJ4_THRPL|nr:DNA N6-methyl adenine demethylase isoform X2 [Thrips palmi]